MNIEDFKNQLKGGGARPNLFRVRVTFPGEGGSIAQTAAGAAVGAAAGGVAGALTGALGAGGPARQLEFMCKGAQIPPSNIGTIEVPFRGRQLKIPGDRTFDEWTITVLNDTTFNIRNAFEEWSNLINAHESNTGVTAPAGYMQRAEVEQLDRSENVVKKYILEGCWPQNIGEIELAHDNNDTIEEYTVTLQYQYWTADTTS